MDLDHCPKCGAQWQGNDRCRQCGFVPIGAGLDKLPKKRKKRARRYVEPGSMRPMLTYGFVGLVGFGCFQYKPWQDDWELIRALMGQGRRHNIVGQWEVVKSMTIKRDGTLIFGKKPIQKGLLTFGKTGGFALDLYQGGQKSAGRGKYVVTGQLVAVNGLQVTGSDQKLPNPLKFRLSWSGANSLLATNGSEAIYLRRRAKSGSPIANLMQMGLKPGKAEAPGAMRGVIATLQKNVNDETSD